MLYLCNNRHRFVYVLTEPLHHESIFKRNTTGLNSEFSFSESGCQNAQFVLLFTNSWENKFIPPLSVLALYKM